MYDYTTDAHKLKLFPSTLKAQALRWFMGLRNKGITTWNTMKIEFLNKYQDYCRGREIKDEVLRMQKKEDETLEDYLEKFQFSLQCSKHSTMPEDTLKVIFLKGMVDECLDALNLMLRGDIFQLSFDDIKSLCQNYSRATMRKGKVVKATGVVRENNSKNDSRVTKGEISNLLKNFKIHILSTFSNSLDQFIIVKKKKGS